MQAKDVMTTDVVTARPDMSVVDVVALLLAHRIGGMPVVDSDGKLVGMVSDGDLMRRPELGTEAVKSWWLRLFVDRFRDAAAYAKSHGRHVQDVMTKKVVTVTEDTSLAQIAAILETHRIKRVPVMRGRDVVGIVSRANLVQGLAARGEAVAPSGPTDAELRQRAIAAVKGQVWANLRTTNVTVVNGVAELWGLVFDDAERDAWRIAMENVPGIVKVVDRRMTLPTTSELIFGKSGNA